MIGPNPPDMVDPWDTDPNTQAAWRERERRQRTVRLLMMFLLMLLLMDGEEQSARRRSTDPNYNLRKRKNSKKKIIMEGPVYRSRRDQENRLSQIARTNPRFARLLNMHENGMESSHGGKTDDRFSENFLLKDADKEEKVWDYPWNSTGFYRGEWVRDERDEEEEETRHDDDEKVNDMKIEKKLMSCIDLEGVMMDRLNETEEDVGVYLLPRGTRVKMHNYTATKVEQAAAKAVSNGMKKAKTNNMFSWFRIGQPELNEVVASAEDENEPAPSVTLTKRQGRAAFQFYSRAVPGMKELSLVDGFVKLYDSNTVGYSTRRDILLRVRGVLIHSIGRLSLVSHAEPGRSALIISDQFEKEKETSKETPKPAIDEGEDKTTKRRLSELFGKINSAPEKVDLEMVRNHVLNLYPADELEVDEEWDITQSIGPELFPKDNYEDGGMIFRIINYFKLSAEEVHEKYLIQPFSFDCKSSFSELGITIEFSSLINFVLSHFGNKTKKKARRRLIEAANNESLSLADLEENQTAHKMNSETNDTTTDDTPHYLMLNNSNASEFSKRVTEKPETNLERDNQDDSKETSEFVIPFPYVPDDKAESIRRAKTPAARKMPAREQLLEANAGRCEFEIKLDVKEVEWTLGEWTSFMKQQTLDISSLDPSLQEKEPEDGDSEDDEGNNKATKPKRKHSESSSGRETAALKSRQEKAVVMAINGSIHSPNCDFTSSLNATAIRTDWEHTTGKAINYSFYMMLTCLTQIVVLLRQLLHTQHQSTATRVSLLCIGWQTVLDALLCLGHIYLSLAMQPVFTAFASVAFFKLLIFCVIEMKYMSIIIQARNNANGGQSTTELLRRQVAMLHLRFYVALVTAFLVFFSAGQQYRTIYMVVLYSFWVPQIIQNIISEAKRPLHVYYIYGMSISRCVAPLYMFAVPNNFLKEVYPDSPTNYLMVEILIIWIAVQTAVLIAQDKYGARFMVPARFLPPKFDYHRPIPQSLLPTEVVEQDLKRDRTPSPPPLKSESPELKTTGTRNRLKKKGGSQEHPVTTMTTESITPPTPALDCVICCNGIDHHNRKGYMLAPCEHIFHKDCLIQWMDVKMECPICRTELPAI